MTRPPSSGSDELDPIDSRNWPPPPEPSSDAWEAVRRRIAARLPSPTVTRRVSAFKWVSGIAAVAALLLIAVGVWNTYGTQGVTPPVEPVADADAGAPPDPLAEYDVLPIATAEDVMVSAVRGEEVRFGTVNHPVPDDMPLALSDDVTVSHGPSAGELACPEPGGAAVYVMLPDDK